MTADGQINFSVHYSSCNQLCVNRRRCSIYQDRPLICRLYPLGLEIKADGAIAWVLHWDCLYVRRMEKRNMLSDFKQHARNIIDNLSEIIKKEIIETCRVVYTISIHDEKNNYILID